MSSVVVAKDPNLKFLNTSRRIDQNNACPLPMVLKKGGKFDWDANSFITHYGGGSQTYNIRPLAKTVQKKAYSLNLFCDFLENNSINLSEINDSTLYQYIKESKDRNIKDSTVIQHGRTAIEYIDYLSKIYPEWKLGTTEKDPDKIFSVHYEKLKFKKGSITGEYFYHESLVGLINIASEAEYVHDHELVMWLDAINCTTNHPRINTFLISRWEALTTLLDITGSRISEAHEITRTMIKKAADSLLISDKQPIIRNIPIRKGKYKGKTRSVKTTHEDIQVILLYVHIIEDMFPDMEHDALFVDSVTGKPLKSTYLKNYAKKVINGSKYSEALKHLTNHSFRHRFITLNIAKAIKKISAQGSFSSILSVASNACRKVTMHANNESMSHYVHLATEYNEKNDQGDIDMSNISPQIRIRVKKLISIVNLFHLKEINEAEALDSLLSTINEFKKFT